MEKLDKVIAGLSCCGEANKSVDACLAMCPYYGERDGDKVCMDFLMEDALGVIEKLREENRDLRKDIEVLTEDNTRLERRLKVARVERDSERARMTRLIGMVHKEWLEKVHPDWYERLHELDYEYDPVKDGTPWYRAEAVWGCIEEVAE